MTRSLGVEKPGGHASRACASSRGSRLPASNMRMRPQLAFVTFRATRMAQCHLRRPTCGHFGDGLRDTTDCKDGIVICRPCNGLSRCRRIKEGDCPFALRCFGWVAADGVVENT